MPSKSIVKLAILTAFAIASMCSAHAATTTYTNLAAFTGAAGTTTLQNFNSPSVKPKVNDTSVVYSDVTFSCSGNSHCPSFFGASKDYVLDGYSVFFATPDVATFTFKSPISAFGVLIAGLGDIGADTLTISDSSGFTSAIFSNYKGTTTSFTNGVLFAGLISDTPFSSVSFSGSKPGDGIFFENLHYGNGPKKVPPPPPPPPPPEVSAVPLPAGLPLVATGLGLLAILARRRSPKFF